MTDPDTIAAFNALRAARDTTPDTLEAEPLPATPDSLKLPPTDGEIFDSVPKALPEEITEKIERANIADDNWDEAVTEVREVPRLRPYDPTGCMM